MTSGNPFKLIVFFTLPLLLGNVFQQFYTISDTFIVSQTLGLDALAAVGATGSITFLILGLAIGLTAGLAVITAQRFGRKDEAALKRSLTVSIVITSIVSIMITIIAALNTRNILTIMQTPPEIIDLAYDYLFIIFLGIGPTVMFNFLANILRAIGDSQTPLFFLIISSLLNIALDYLFILGFNLDLAGAGIATVMSQLVASLLCMVYIKKKIHILHIRKRDWTLEWAEYAEHLRIGLPYGFQYSIIAVGSIAIQVTLNQLGALSVAAFTAASKIDQLLTMPLPAFGITMSTFAAQNFGAKQFTRIKKGMRVGLLITISYSFVIGLILFFGGRFMSSFFVNDANSVVLDLAEQFFKLQAPFYSLLALVFLLRHTIQGVGNSFAPTLAGIMELVGRVIGAFVLAHYFGFNGAVIASPLAWLCAIIPLGLSYYFTQHLLTKEASPISVFLSLGSKKVLEATQNH